MNGLHYGNHRLYQLDALRLIGVLSVVALHAGLAYSAVIPWWYVADPDKSRLINIVLAVCDGVPMPLLFAVAGYFALPSLARRGPGGFLAGRAVRLLAPLVGLTFFYCPIIAYVDYLGKGGRDGFFSHWLALVPSALNWRFAFFSGAESSVAALKLLWPFHLWFLAVLFVFCLILAGARWVAGPGLARRLPDQGPGWVRFGLLALAVGAAAGVGQLACSDTAWVRVGPLLVFQPARLPLYAGCFLLGTFAWRRGWFAVHALPGRPWVWGLVAVAGLAAMLATGLGAGQARAAGTPALGLAFAHGLGRTWFALAATGFAAVLLARAGAGSIWRRPGLSPASYTLYLLHFPPVIVLQYALVGTLWPVAAKFAVCFAVPAATCLTASRLTDRSRLALPVLVGLVFGLCALLWR
jgi:peptidoglycan/LPS O-acetylase OafA/YrhL